MAGVSQIDRRFSESRGRDCQVGCGRREPVVPRLAGPRRRSESCWRLAQGPPVVWDAQECLVLLLPLVLGRRGPGDGRGWVRDDIIHGINLVLLGRRTTASYPSLHRPAITPPPAPPAHTPRSWPPASHDRPRGSG